MTARSFMKQWLAALLGVTLFGMAFPFLLPTLIYATDCRNVGGACGAVALVFGIVLRLPVVIGVGIYLAVLTWKRSRVLSLLPWGFAFVLLTYIAASPIVFGFGNFWASRFALGVSGEYGLPAFGFLIAALSGLSLLPDAERDQPDRRARIATFSIGGVSLLFLLPAILDGLRLLPWPGNIALLRLRFAVQRPLLHLTGPHFPLIVLMAFAGSLAWWVSIAARRSVDTDGHEDRA